MNLSDEQVIAIFKRIDHLTTDHKALFGKMNVRQMVCHCTDQIRLALGTKKALEYGKADPQEILRMAREKQPTPTPKGFDQVRGEGTPPSNDFESDKKQLKEHITSFQTLSEDFKYPPHPYFGDVDRNYWTKLVLYHLDHHLDQFGV